MRAPVEPAGLRKGVTYNAAGIVTDCLFCRIMSGTAPAKIVAQDDKFVAFKTIAPASSYHLLISPRQHIKNIDALTREDVPFLKDLKSFGLASLTADQAQDVQLSFHVPPYNSIDHLHLHVIAYKSTRSWFDFFKYMPGAPWCVDVDTLITRLDRT